MSQTLQQEDQHNNNNNKNLPYTQAEKEEYMRMIFAAFDDNGNGFLEELELSALLSFLKGPTYVRERNMKVLIKKFDSNFDGKMSFEEVKEWLSDMLDGKEVDL